MTSTPPEPLPAPAPEPVAAPNASPTRALAPDLARGVMLLFIAVANSSWYLWDAPERIAAGHPVPQTVPDTIAQSLAILFIDARSYPLFAFLFGYGIWQLYLRRVRQGFDPASARAALRRRYAILIAIGALHGVLLWYGDILAAYGVLGLLIVALLVHRGDRAIWITVVVILALTAVTYAFAIPVIAAAESTMGSLLGDAPGLDSLSTDSVIGEANPALAAVFRTGVWLVALIGTVSAASVQVPVLLGVLAARRRVLEEPRENRVLLVAVSVGGIGVAVLGGVVALSYHVGMIEPTLALDTLVLMVATNAGTLGGLGYAALFALVSDRPGVARSRAASWLAALGRRSLTGYLLQSLLMAPLLSGWGLGLGADLTSWSIMLVAVAAWAVGLVLAIILEKAGRTGPAEWVLRRLGDPPAARARTRG